MAREPAETADIFGAQPADTALLAELYDLEHDEITEDLAFYRDWVRRSGATAVLDLGCGSGRLFRALLDGGAQRIVGIDGSPALLERAERRIGEDERLAQARAGGRIELAAGDVRHVRRRDRFGLVVLAGVIAHLGGPEDAVEALGAVASVLEPDGRAIVDTLGPGGLPEHELPMSVDWEKRIGDRRVVRRSSLELNPTPEGLRVAYSTLTDLVGPDGTIARVPASFRLWYPSPSAVAALAEEAGLVVEAAFGSHDLAPLDDESERCIVVLRPASDGPGVG
ncbi:MAG TPA: class I SAM-dependent methyltransferase [Candidatus Limnocylindria bacterium]|nr:class I SAM-dependent methyltransferase [Candidatus Limnocylindria bacterium]